MTDDQRTSLINDCLARLSEHFDHVQIMTTWNEDGLSRHCFLGAGNFYARLGMAHGFISEDHAQDNAWQLAKVIKPEGE